MFSCLCLTAFGQAPASNKPNGQLQAGPVAGNFVFDPVQGSYGTGIKVNYVRVREAIGRIQSETAFSTAAYQDVRENTLYLDGLGRPLQTVSRQITPAATDLVAPVKYDEFGREVTKYLPYVAASTSGGFRLDPFNEQKNFMQLKYPGEQVYYGKTIYENSPLNRVEKTFAPGNSWAGSEGSGSEKSTQQKYLVNTETGDAVRIWNITNAALSFSASDDNVNIPLTSALYGDGKLFKNVLIDESGNAAVEYKNLEGLVILKKVQSGTIASDFSGYNGFLCTYYIYDDFNQLRFVIPPKAVQAIQPGWTLTTGVINELCFRYEYDGRRRMIAKKVPGAGWTYMIYDQRDRLIFTQDANLRAQNQWLTTLYDQLNRPAVTGMLTYMGTVLSLQDYVTQHSGSSTLGQIIVQNGIVSILTVNQRELGKTLYQASQSITFDPEFESEAGAEFIAEITTGSGVGETIEVTDNPLPDANNFIALTITYYDQNALSDRSYTTSYNNNLDASGDPNVEVSPTAANQFTRGMITASKVRVIEDPNNLAQGAWLANAMYFDEKGRVVQGHADNYKGGKDIVTTLYNFSGKVLCIYQVHDNPAAGSTGTRVRTRNKYDHAGRLLETYKVINDDLIKEVLISKSTYDNMGQLQSKELGRKRDVNGNYTSSPLQVSNYEYNIRGWLKGINKDYANNIGSTTDRWFGFELNYDWGYGRNQFNGNIAGMKWISKGDGERRSFGYTYDKVNRIMGGDFSQYNGNAYADNVNNINFDMLIDDPDNHIAGMGYDENGNILAMRQWGLKTTTSQVIDDMSYAYYSNSNKLKSVTEAAGIGNTDNKLGDFTDRNSGDDYGYDKNGNMIADLNKRLNGVIGIDQISGGAIQYNHLNLPYRINVKNDLGADKGYIMYIYDANGNKLEKRVHENPSSTNGNTTKDTKTSYLGSFIYENDVLQFFGQEEGRIRPRAGGTTAYNYDYFLIDHLGNVRMVLTDEQQTDIYPAATLEGNVNTSADAVYLEKSYYNINTSNIVSRSVATGIPNYPNNNTVPNNNPNSNTTANSQQLYMLNSNTAKIGLGMTLKVMAGDKINIYGNSYYFYSGGMPPKDGLPVSALLDMFIGGSPLQGKGLTSTQLANDVPGLVGAVTGFMNNSRSPSTKPQAYINWIFFDEQFKFAGGGFDAVSDINSNLKTHSIPAIDVPRNGYIFVYCSNETPIDVFFDNLQLIHTRGPLVEETHYYPFGLEMRGLCSEAVNFGMPGNKRKYNQGSELNNKEFSDGSGLEWYSTFFRMYDPQIGRWHVIDPKPNFQESLYSGMGNNPVKFNDPLGDKVRKEGYTEAQILSWLAIGLQLAGKQVNPFYFKNGNLQYNKKLINSLSKTQRSIANNILGAIDSKKTHILVKAWDNKFIGPPGNMEIHRDKFFGTTTVFRQPDQKMKPEDAAMTGPEKDGNTIKHYINEDYFFNNRTENAPVGADGKAIENPIWLVMFHEIGGHGYLKYDLKGVKNQASLSVDYENVIRSLHNMKQRAYDSAHSPVDD